MNWFDSYLDRAMADDRVSRRETRDLNALLETHQPNRDRLAEMRSVLFDRLLARPKVDAEARLQVAESVIRALASWESSNAAASIRFETLFFPGKREHDRLISLIGATRKTADICVFTITDDRISDRLIDLHKRGVRVRIISDNDKSGDRGSDIDRLNRAGIRSIVDVSEHHMHHKFAVLDDQWALTGSYNWTRSAANYNRENLLVTDAHPVVRAFADEFERLWGVLT